MSALRDFATTPEPKGETRASERATLKCNSQKDALTSSTDTAFSLRPHLVVSKQKTVPMQRHGFPNLPLALTSLGHGHIVDGEVCVLDNISRSDFDRLHRRALRRRWYPGADLVVYCVFDLLVKAGRDIRSQSYERRKVALAALLANKPDTASSTSTMSSMAIGFFEQALALRLEGIVGKRADSSRQHIPSRRALARLGEDQATWRSRPQAIPTGNGIANPRTPAHNTH